MANRDRVSEIRDIKQRQNSRSSVSFHFLLLQHQWRDLQDKNQDVTAFFPIRAVTLIEVFTKRWITTLIDYGAPYDERAVPLAKNVKLDYETMRALHGRSITLGDLISHSTSINNFEQLMNVFETLMGKDFQQSLKEAVDRFAVEFEGKPSSPIIVDFQNNAATIAHLFQIRHILVHEYPSHPAYAVEEVTVMLDAAANFTQAIEEVCSKTLHGKIPFTTLEICESIGQEWETIDNELQDVLKRLTESIDGQGRQLLADTQDKWQTFQKAQCEFRADNARGGSMAGILYMSEKRSLAKARLDQMHWYIEREEGQL